MAKRGPTTFAKRQRELQKQERRQAKLERRAQRKEEKATRPDRAERDHDPDIAGIVPGPQPSLEEQGFVGDPVTDEVDAPEVSPPEA